MEFKRHAVVGLCIVLVVSAASPVPYVAGISHSADPASFCEQALILLPGTFPGRMTRRPAIHLFGAAAVVLGFGIALGVAAHGHRGLLWKTMLVVAAGVHSRGDKGGRREPSRRLFETALKEETVIKLEIAGVQTLDNLAALDLRDLNKLLNVDELIAVARLRRQSGYADWVAGSSGLDKLIQEIYQDLGPPKRPRRVLLPPPEISPPAAVVIKKGPSPLILPDPVWPKPKAILTSTSEDPVETIFQGVKMHLKARTLRMLHSRQPEPVQTLGQLSQLDFNELQRLFGVETLAKVIFELIRRGRPPPVTIPFKAVYVVFKQIRHLVVGKLRALEGDESPSPISPSGSSASA